MITKEQFDEERKECEELSHIEKDITDPTLAEIDRLYGAADVLSMKHALVHHERLLNISLIAPFIVFYFILYEVTEHHWLIIVVTALILLLYYVYSRPEDEGSHERYLEYRVLAESLRVQYFISKAGINKNVADILPWFTEIRVPLVKNVLNGLTSIETDKKESIMECWVIDQMKYHDRAHKKSLKLEEKHELYEKISLYATILIYALAFVFEILMMAHVPIDFVDAHFIRAFFKIGIGTATAITIFLKNYFGKLSLSSKIEEHKRMHWLYENVEHKMKTTREESEEQILYLAEQCLIENTIWYSHQKNNDPDFAVE
ncbi:hypothetical protein [Methanobrevibacter sp.]